MDPSNANIYTREQAEALGLDFDELISMEDDAAQELMKKRLADELAAVSDVVSEGALRQLDSALDAIEAEGSDG